MASQPLAYKVFANRDLQKTRLRVSRGVRRRHPQQARLVRIMFQISTGTDEKGGANEAQRDAAGGRQCIKAVRIEMSFLMICCGLERYLKVRQDSSVSKMADLF